MRLAIANKACVEQASLVEAGALPLVLAIPIFESKIDGFLSYGRWLLACVEGAEALYNSYFDQWALRLLGAPPWFHGAKAQSELGWALSGFARAVRDMGL